jgi:D-alanyl-D-alanine carboxypeptidase
MSVDGLQAVQVRISEIRAQLGIRAATAPPAARTDQAAAGASFESVLAAAMGTGATTSPTATVKAPGAYGPLAPPPELARYGNGRIPPAMLSPVAGGQERLYAPAAEAFEQMAADARRAGVTLDVNDGYRSFEGQEAMAERVGLYSNGGRAAVPGTSTHGWGLSVDVDTGGGAVEWLRANAARYGFVEDVPREPWHWTFRPDG